jgi:tetratricopeptide (TPR) repeat protein
VPAILTLVILAAIAAVFRDPLGRALIRLTGGAKPNLLLITLDTTRADYLGCYGRADAQTPNLDRLARAGVLFRRCSTSSVQTLPAHCTIMTGLDPYVHGVRRNRTEQLPPAATTLAEVLKQAGYAAAAAVGSYVLDPQFGLAQGFDTYRAVPPPQPGITQRKGDEVAQDAGDFKYVLSSAPKLYNLALDPGETRDLAADQPDLATALRDQLRTLIAEAPPPLPGETNVDLSGDELARLESLGYLSVVADPNEAAALYEQVLACTPADSRTRLRYASMLMDAQRWEPAMAQANQVLAQLPEDGVAHSMLGVALATLGRLDEAQAHLEAAVRAAPRNPDALHAPGPIYYKRGRRPEAAECFRRALAAAPGFEPARAALRTVEPSLQK